MIPVNPMAQFDKSAPQDQIQALRGLFMLLGGLGKGPAALPLSPSLSQPTPRPEPQGLMPPILGGLS